ncbi:hypothetical protein RND81_13G026700 [Saponaria officinalis]|uniref:Reverse transcriptase domain-containing protein n=1 Tax=Saponaria officinalis TaxID=3572 RepID=A0AAW1GYR8_SAPOF
MARKRRSNNSNPNPRNNNNNNNNNNNKLNNILNNSGGGISNSSGQRGSGNIPRQPSPVLSPESNPQATKTPETFGPLNLGGLGVIGEEREQERVDEGWRTVGRKSSAANTESNVWLRLELADVCEEIEYWSTAVVGYVLGANPPHEVLSGFIKRIWGKFEYDNISFLQNGVFLVHFKSKEVQAKVVELGFPMFDTKPVVVKAWSPEVCLEKEMVSVVPTWIRLNGLALKFWGEGCLLKIASLVGVPIRLDAATSLKHRLGYARVLVEVPLGGKCVEEVSFYDELDQLQEIHVMCKGFGHEDMDCMKVVRRIWVPVRWPAVQAPPEPVVSQLVVPGPVATTNAQSIVPQHVVSQLVVSPVLNTPLPNLGWGASGTVMGPGGGQLVVSGQPGISLNAISFMEALNSTLHASMARLGSPSHKDLRWHLHKNNVGLWGVVETKVRISSFNKVVVCFASDWEIINNLQHHDGGRIWLMWRKAEFKVDVICKTEQLIHSKVTKLGSGKVFLFTVVYGSNSSTERDDLWEALASINSSLSWTVGGDFNFLMNPNERVGAPVKLHEIDPFRRCAQLCDLSDLKSTGVFFTGTNKQDGDNRVLSKLDRVLVNPRWLSLFPDAYVEFLPEGLYDHSPGLVHLMTSRRVGKASFMFFNMWTLVPEFLEIVQASWLVNVNGVPMFSVIEKLRRLKQPLKKLNGQSFSDIEQKAELALSFLKEVQCKVNAAPHDINLREMERTVRMDCVTLVEARNSFLSQKSKCAWVEGADTNTGFLHDCLRARRAYNKVIQIKCKEGILHTSPDGIELAFLKYYKALLGESSITSPVCQRIVASGPVQADEVRLAMFSIDNDKAPGPDGYTSLFYKRAWHIDFFVSGRLLKQLNATTISLIPKSDRPDSVLDFRPIACYNVLYKCLAKVICNRLGIILPKLLNRNQGAFVRGRLYNRKSASPRCLMKIDIRKAYDSHEWGFLGELLGALNFPVHFVNLIMQCVSTPCYSIVVNGNKVGDPLSPLLFAIWTEEDFRFHPLCKPLKLNHLCFADDLMELMIRGFLAFSDVSGLHMNVAKSNVFFNSVAPVVGALPFKYLGINISPKRLSVLECELLVEKIIKRIRGWGSRKLSYAGRLTLVQSVLQTLQSYWASVNYLWDGDAQYAQSPPIAWTQACQCKKYGAIGKLVWWRASNADKLWVQWPSTETSWSWRRISGIWGPDQLEYTIDRGYQWFHPNGATVAWSGLIWTSIVVPEHSFVCWLAMWGRLYTGARQQRLGISHEVECYMCGHDFEDNDHLFFNCCVSNKCLRLVIQWLDIQADWHDWKRLMRSRRITMFQRMVCFRAFCALVHHIWDVRNKCRLFHYVLSPKYVLNCIKWELKCRVGLVLGKLGNDDRAWLSRVGM